MLQSDERYAQVRAAFFHSGGLCLNPLFPYRQNLFCDVTLVADNMEIPAHKMVLAACSPYFYAMFSVSEFEESRQDRITVQGVDFVALQLLIEYVYTSFVEVTEENVQVNSTLATRLGRIVFK